MHLRISLLTAIALPISACASIEGVYLPACEAYAGSEIRLVDGRFHWSKFTDQVEVDDDGNTVDPFPGFPLKGDYWVDGKTVTLTPDSGQPVETLYLFGRSGELCLLTSRENAEIEAGGERPKCALQRQPRGT